MNDLPTLPDNTPAHGAPAAPETLPEPARHPASDESRLRQVTVAVIVLGLLLAALAWSSYNRMHAMREDLARAIQRSEQADKETARLASTVSDQSRDLQVKVGVLENRQIESEGQQLALEQLYQELSKNRDEWALAEVEQVLSTASQQLQLASNVQGALIALQNADRSLSRSDKPQFITIRRAIARDIDRLKALPQLDMTGVAVRIDSVIAQVDTLPLLADEVPAPAARREPATKAVAGQGAAAGASQPAGARLRQAWRDWSADMWAELRELIRVRKVDTPEALMLSPQERYFVRENLKLRLLNARVALLSRNEAAFRSDLEAAQDTLARYFDTGARSTQSAQALLRQVQANNLAVDMPTLAESLNAVRNYKANP